MPPYIKGEEELAGLGAWHKGVFLLGLLVQVGFAPLSFLPQEGIGRRGREKGKGGAAPSSFSYSDSLGRGA